MLQRQIILKQLQELQLRQQLQELSDSRNQDIANQLGSPKQASGIQFTPTVNGAPFHNSPMIQGSPNGLILSQYNGLSPPCDMSLYGTTISNTDKNLNLYAHLQGQYNHSMNLMTKNSSNAFGISTMQSPAFASSLVSQQGNFSTEQTGMTDDLLLPNQVFQEKNLFGQVPVHSLNRDLLSVNYSPQGVSVQGNRSVRGSEEGYGHTGSRGTPGKISKLTHPADSLDPLEQKILYHTDDNCWELSLGSSKKTGTVGFETAAKTPSRVDTMPSIQGGRWSALMQSAVAESSSSDTTIQEEWSGLSFQNPEPSTENQPSNFENIGKSQDNWVDRNTQNAPSPCSEPQLLFQKIDENYSFPGFHQSGHQYLKQKDEFQSESSHASGQHSPQNTMQLIDSSFPSSNTWPGQCHTSRGTLWLHGNTSNSVTSGIQKSFDQVNQMNILNYSGEEKMTAQYNVEPMSAFLGGSADLHGEKLTAQSFSGSIVDQDDISSNHNPGIQLYSKVSSLHKLPLAEASATDFTKSCNSTAVSQGFSFGLQPVDAGTPQSYSFSPSMSMGNSCAASLPSDYVNNVNNHHEVPSGSTQWTAKLSAYNAGASHANFQQRGMGTDCLESPIMEKVAATQSPGASDLAECDIHQTVLPTPSPGAITYEDIFPGKPYKSSSKLFQFPTRREWPYQNYFKHEQNIQEFGTSSGPSGKSGYRGELEGSSEIHIPGSIKGHIPTVESSEKFQHSESVDVASGSGSFTSMLPSSQPEQRDVAIPTVPPGDNRGRYLQQNQSLLHQLNSPGNAEADYGTSFPLQYDLIKHQKSIGKAAELLSSGESSLVKDKAATDLEAIHQGALDGNSQISNLSLGGHNNQSEKDLLVHQDFQQLEKLDENGNQRQSILSNKASNVAYKSPISLQMAPSWFKHYGTMKNDPLLLNHPKGAISAAEPSSTRNMQGHNLVPMNSDVSQESGQKPCLAATFIETENIMPTGMFPSDISYQNMAVSKKRKIGALDMVPWHKEVNREASRLQNISMAESEWAHVLKRRQEGGVYATEIVDDVLPVVRSKRRLIFTTQLMQLVVRPAPAVILWTDAWSHHDDVAYCAARLALGDACNLMSKQLKSTNDVSFDKLKTSKRRSDYEPKAVEGLISRMEKLEGNLSRFDKSFSVVDILAESKELEKVSTINRFAKFHFRAHPGTVDPTSSSGQSIMPKTGPQRYVTAVPMPRSLPEGVDCLSL